MDAMYTIVWNSGDRLKVKATVAVESKLGMFTAEHCGTIHSVLKELGTGDRCAVLCKYDEEQQTGVNLTAMIVNVPDEDVKLVWVTPYLSNAVFALDALKRSLYEVSEDFDDGMRCWIEVVRPLPCAQNAIIEGAEKARIAKAFAGDKEKEQ